MTAKPSDQNSLAPPVLPVPGMVPGSLSKDAPFASRLNFLWCGEGLVGDLRFDLEKQRGGGPFSQNTPRSPDGIPGCGCCSYIV